MLISFIIPVYNGEKTICNAIESILKQSLRCEKEIIVVNDGSTDDTLEKLKHYKKSIVILNQKNTGPYLARLNGLKISTGELISFLDADDELYVDFLEKLLPLFLKHNLDCIQGCVSEGEQRKKHRTKLTILDSKEKVMLELIRWGGVNAFFHTKIYKRKVLSLLFTFDPGKIHLEDMASFHMIVNECNSFGVTNLIVYKYNKSTSGRFCSGGIQGYLDNIRALIIRHNSIKHNYSKAVVRESLSRICNEYKNASHKIKNFRKLYSNEFKVFFIHNLKGTSFKLFIKIIILLF